MFRRLLILLLAAGLVDAAAWTTPGSVVSYTQANASYAAAKSIDGNISWGWAEYNASGSQVEDASGYDWGITYDLGNSYTVSRVQIYDAGLTSNKGAPCNVYQILVCSSSTCAGESSVGSVTERQISASALNTFGWTNSTTFSRVGRYVKLIGGVNAGTCTWTGSQYVGCSCSPVLSDAEMGTVIIATMNELREVQVLTDVAPPAPPESGPCRAFCDYQMMKYVPAAPDGNFNVSHIWNVTLTGTDTNPEGQSYVNDTFSNVLITTTNGTKTGTCANHVPGAIYWVGRIGASGRNTLVVNYTYGNITDATCTLTPPSLTLCFNGTAQNTYPYTLRTEIGNVSSSYAIVADSYKFNHYNLTYYNDVSAGLYNFTLQPATTTFYCGGQYEAFPISLTPTATSYIVQTRTKADIVTALTSGPSRTYQTEGGGADQPVSA